MSAELGAVSTLYKTTESWNRVWMRQHVFGGVSVNYVLWRRGHKPHVDTNRWLIFYAALKHSFHQFTWTKSLYIFVDIECWWRCNEVSLCRSWIRSFDVEAGCSLHGETKLHQALILHWSSSQIRCIQIGYCWAHQTTNLLINLHMTYPSNWKSHLEEDFRWIPGESNADGFLIVQTWSV